MREVPLYAGTCIHPLPASASNAVQHPHRKPFMVWGSLAIEFSERGTGASRS